MNSTAPPPVACDYCGLPLRGSARTEGAEKEYCCFGCRIAAAINDDRGDAGAVRGTLTRLGLGVFFTLNESVFSMALWSADVYDADRASGAMAGAMDELFRYLSLLFALPVLWLLGGPLLANAWRDVCTKRFSADLLLLAGVVASFAYSMVNVFRGAGQIYFEVGCVVLTMVTLGRWLEAAGKLKTTESLSALEKLLPSIVRVLRGSELIEKPLAELAVGDVVRVFPGERIPTDGRLRSAVVSVDEQLLTGESRPAVKECGDTLLGGSLNLDGDLWMEVTAPASAGTLARLIEAVRVARMQKGRYERIADQVAAWFGPLVAGIALATLLAHAATHGWEVGLMASLAVILIACPCALGIATPMAIWAAIGQASQFQVLFRHGEAIERLAKVRALRFDKTGTLTTGVAEVCDIVIDAQSDQAEVLALASELAAASNHVFASAIVERLGAPRGPQRIAEVNTIAGRGIVGVNRNTGNQIVLGNFPLARQQGLAADGLIVKRRDVALAEGESFTLVGWDGRVRGLFVFREQLRPGVHAALAQCLALDLDLAVLTGDHAARGESLARELGIRVDAELLPEQKLRAIARVKRIVGPVAMIGDGVNDAPALAASDVGIAMGCGADLTRDAAAVCLMGNDLSRLPWSIELARKTVHVIRLNLFWAFAYNMIGVGLAAAGWLNPMWAAGAMVGSSLFVVVNSLRLRGDAPETTSPREAEREMNPTHAHRPARETAA